MPVEPPPTATYPDFVPHLPIGPVEFPVVEPSVLMPVEIVRAASTPASLPPDLYVV
jgi:hypothetical protein